MQDNLHCLALTAPAFFRAQQEAARVDARSERLERTAKSPAEFTLCVVAFLKYFQGKQRFLSQRQATLYLQER